MPTEIFFAHRTKKRDFSIKTAEKKKKKLEKIEKK